MMKTIFRIAAISRGSISTRVSVVSSLETDLW